MTRKTMPDVHHSTFTRRRCFLVLLPVIFVLFFISGRSSASTLTDQLGISLFDAREKAPDIAAPDLSGRILRLSDYRGKVVLLNFWATWCDPCRKEIPSLISLRKKLAGRPFVIVSVAMDRRLVHIPPFVRKFGIWRDVAARLTPGISASVFPRATSSCLTARWSGGWSEEESGILRLSSATFVP
jgi:thiol-disulfide isomerase/thioredoxin